MIYIPYYEKVIFKNHAARNTLAYISDARVSLKYTPGWDAGSRSARVLNVTRHCVSEVPTNCPVYENSFYFTAWARLVISAFLIFACLVGVKCYLTVVQFCISLTTNKAEHLFTCLLAVCVSCSKKCLFMSFTFWKTFLVGCLSFSYRWRGFCYTFWKLLLCHLKWYIFVLVCAFSFFLY